MTTKTYDKKEGLPIFTEEGSGDNGLPIFTDNVKKKGTVTPSNDGGEVLPTGTESTSPSKSFSLSGSPFDIEGIFRPGSERQKAIATLTSDLPKVIQSVNNKVHFGDIKAEELSSLYNKEGGKEIVKSIVRQYAPDIPEEFIGSGESLDLAAKNIKIKNRVNAKTGKDAYLNEVDNELAKAITDYRTVKVSVSGGTGGASVAVTENPFPNIDINNPFQYGGAIDQLKRADKVVDKNNQEVVGGKERLIAALQEKAKSLTADQGIDPEVNALSEKVSQAIARSNLNREMGENIPTDEFAKNDKLNEEHFKLGLSYIKKVNPGQYKNVTRVIDEGKQIPDDDFRNISNSGQQIYNEQVFFGAADKPELIDKETYLDYTTRGDKKAQYAAIIGERLKGKSGITRKEYKEDEIKKAGADLPNKSIVQELANEEKIFGYDAIPKSGILETIIQGINQPIDGIRSTFELFSESPVDTYIRSKKLDVGSAQKVVGEDGQVSNVLPSDRGNIYYDALRGVGQFIPQILLTKGIGGGAAGVIAADARVALSPALKAGISTYGGTAISTFLQTYGDSYADYLQKTGDPSTARLAGTIDAGSAAAFETFILPDVKIADRALAGLRGELVSDIVSLVKKGGDPALLASKGRSFVEKFAKGVINIQGQEIAEEVGTNIVDVITEAIFSPQTAKDRDLGAEVLETVKQTAVSMAIPSLFGAGGESVNRDFARNAFDAAAIGLPDYKQILDKALNNGSINQETYNSAVSLLSSHQQSINAVPRQDANGTPIPNQKQLDYAFEDTKIKVYEENAKNSTGVTKEMWEGKIKQSQDIQREIVMPKAGEKIKIEPLEDVNERFKPKVEEAAVIAPQETKEAIVEQSEGAAENVVPSTLDENRATEKKPTLDELTTQFGIEQRDADNPFWKPTERSAKDVMDWIENSEYSLPHEKELLKKYKELVSPDLKIVFNTEMPPNRSGGSIYHKGKLESIEINPKLTTIKGSTSNFGNTVIHEITHALTYDNTGKMNEGLINNIAPLFDVAHEYISKNLKQLTEKYKSEHKITYGLSGINEFAAEAMSNRQFQEILASIPYKGTTKSVWAKVIDGIKNYFSKILGTNNETLLNEVVNHVTNYIEPTSKQKTTPTNEAKTDSNVQTVEAVETPKSDISVTQPNPLGTETTTEGGISVIRPEPKKSSVILPSENKPPNVVPLTKPERTISRVVPTSQPSDKKGRTPVTLTGNTEQERQDLIKRRKADTFVPTQVTDEQKLLERVNKFNKEGLRFKRSVRGRSELNNIKVSIDNYNKTHKQKYSAVQNRTGNLEFKNTKGDKVRTNNKVTGDLSIDEKGVPLIERSDKTKEVFNELLDRNLFPTGYTVDGRRMTEKQLDGAVQDILDGIPSRGATNYLNALEKMIEKNDFDFSTPDISQQEAITLEDITATEKEQVGELMDEKAVEDFLNEQSNLTPEQEQIISDNIETLIDEYEIIGDTGQVQATPEGSETAGSTSTEQNKVGEDEKAEATKTPENKFDAKVDKAADALIKFLTPKVKVDAQKSGLGVEEIVRAGAAAIKAAYKLEQNIEKAIANGIEEMKKLWDNSFGEFPEDGLKEVMEKEFGEAAPPKQKATEPKQQSSDDEIISKALSLNINERDFPTIFQNNETKQQLAAETQGRGQERTVDIDYVVALEKDLREVSLQTSKLLHDQLGVNWGEKTLKWIEQNPNQGNLAQIVGVLNVISTENYQDIKETHDGNKLNQLKKLQNRIDVVAATRARDASLALRQRILYKQFAQGEDISGVLKNAVLTNEMLDMQDSTETILSEEVTDEEINNAAPLKTTPPKKQSLIRKVTGQAKRQSNPSLKNDLKTKAADIAHRTKKSFKELIDDANAKIKNIKC